MAERERHGGVQAADEPLHRLEQVAISTPYQERMRHVLTAHGARTIDIVDHPNDEPAEAYQEWTITFPEGTRRLFGLRMLRSRSFQIRFPDGFCLRGGELWPLAIREGDHATTVLHLPSEADERHGNTEIGTDETQETSPGESGRGAARGEELSSGRSRRHEEQRRTRERDAVSPVGACAGVSLSTRGRTHFGGIRAQCLRVY